MKHTLAYGLYYCGRQPVLNGSIGWSADYCVIHRDRPRTEPEKIAKLMRERDDGRF
jgi:hypothetical protein